MFLAGSVARMNLKMRLLELVSYGFQQKMEKYTMHLLLLLFIIFRIITTAPPKQYIESVMHVNLKEKFDAQKIYAHLESINDPERIARSDDIDRVNGRLI